MYHMLGIIDLCNNPDNRELGTRTATLDRDGIKKLRSNWVYKIESA